MSGAGATCRSRFCSIASLAALLLSIALFVPFTNGIQTQWTHWGGNKENWRFSDHACLDVSHISKLSSVKPLWNVTTGGTVAATPAVCGGHVYYVDWSGRIVKLTLSGKEVWSVRARTFLPQQSSVGVRTTPAFSEGCKVLFVATQWTKGGTYLLAINSATGKLQYPPTHLDKTNGARVTGSPTFYGGAVFVGISSSHENSPECCSTRGSLVSVNATTGKIKWQTYACPPGYFGCSVWGSAPAIDDVRKQVCFGSANNHRVPASVLKCLKEKPDGSPEQRACVNPRNYVDSVICADLRTGAIKWGYKAHGLDIWGDITGKTPNIETEFKGSKYVSDSDYGFGQSPVFFKSRGTLVAASKGGIAIALNATNGKQIWRVPIGTATGALSKGYSLFGSCTNGKIFCSGLFWYSKKQGAVTCMDVGTGAKRWTWSTLVGGVYGPLTCTQSQVFVPLFDSKGTLAVLDINTGKELGGFATGVTLFSGPAIVNGVLYVGTGYGANGGQDGKSIMAVPLKLRPSCKS